MELDSSRVVMERDDFGTAAFEGTRSSVTSVGFILSNGGTFADSYALTATLPSGFIAAFDPPSPVALNPGERKYGYVNVSVGSGVAQGTHTMRIRAMSNNDAAVPIAQSAAAFQIDVVNTLLPWRKKVTDSPMHEDQPAPLAWSSGGVDYIALAYRQSGRFGERVMFRLSEDGGNTFGDAIPVSPPSYSPGWLTMTRAKSGTYANRLMIAYSAYLPGGFNGDTSDTRGNQVRIAYADPPFTTWTDLPAFDAGEGPATGTPARERNGYRTVNVVSYDAGNRQMLIIEALQYSAYSYGSLTGIRCIAKDSTNGGASWGAWYALDPGSGDRNYAYPHAFEDVQGNIGLWIYEENTGYTGEDPPIFFKYYNGAWRPSTTGRYSVDSSPAGEQMFSQGIGTPQGANGNRHYGLFLDGYVANTEKHAKHVFTDNPAINPPTFNTNSGNGYGPLGNVVASDHSYATRWCSDLSYTTDGYVWATFFRHHKSDPYGQPNILTAYGSPYPTHTTTVNYLTLDSFPKGKVRVAELGRYNFGFYDSLSPEGGADIWMVKYFHEWELEPAPPSGLTVEHNGTLAENNLLTWVHDGTNVAQYNIYRSDAFAGPWGAATLIDSVPVENNTYLDPNKGEHDGVIWWYVVRAQNLVGMEEQNTNAVPEPGGPLPYGINLTGKSGWVFVSFPVDMSGPIEDILDDDLYGDGQTVWDVAKRYDGQTKTWKTYRKGYTDVSTFNYIDNTMGVWLHLTANGGDQFLTLGKYAALPGSAVDIYLYAGWNMVGYPSGTPRNASEALTGTGATMVSIYQPTSPYIQDRTDLENVLMEHGNAYWVWVPADCMWTVQP